MHFADKNIKFFYVTTIIHRRKNKIDALKNNGGKYMSDQKELKGTVMDFYENLFTEDDPTPTAIPQTNGFQVLSSS